MVLNSGEQEFGMSFVALPVLIRVVLDARAPSTLLDESGVFRPEVILQEIGEAYQDMEGTGRQIDAVLVAQGASVQCLRQALDALWAAEQSPASPFVSHPEERGRSPAALRCISEFRQLLAQLYLSDVPVTGAFLSPEEIDALALRGSALFT